MHCCSGQKSGNIHEYIAHSEKYFEVDRRKIEISKGWCTGYSGNADSTCENNNACLSCIVTPVTIKRNI